MARRAGFLGLLLLLALATPVLAAPAASAAPAPSTSQAEAEITSLLRGAVLALGKKDMGYLTSLLDPQAEVEVRGMGLNSRTVGRQRLRQLYGPELARAQAPRVEVRGVQVQPQGNRARLEASLLAFVTPEMPEGMESLGQFAQEVPVPGRLSALLEKQGRYWVFQRLLLVFPGGAR